MCKRFGSDGGGTMRNERGAVDLGEVGAFMWARPKRVTRVTSYYGAKREPQKEPQFYRVDKIPLVFLCRPID
jgi:hypothetical protein